MTSMKAGAFDQKNPYECSVQKQIGLLKQMRFREGWKILPDEFDRLAATAPSWPQGKYCFRSLRLRTGRKERGVQRTFEAAITMLARQYGALEREQQQWLRALRLDKEDAAAARLELTNGNKSHDETRLEWIVIDATPYKREMVPRSPLHLADELFLFLSLFPDFFCEASSQHGIKEFVALGYRVCGLSDGDAAIAVSLTGTTPESLKLSFSLAYDADGFEDIHVSMPSLITKIRF